MLTVLYLDKDASPLEPLKLLLEMTADMIVDVARTDEEGMSRLDNGGVDVIVFGCREGDSRGLEFLKKLRSSGNQTPLIILADVFSEALKSEADKSTNSAFLARQQNMTNVLLLLTETVRSLADTDGGGVTAS